MLTLAADDVLHEDHHLIAVNKPAPLPTQAPAGILSLESLVKSWIKTKYSKPAGVYLGVPHRLDRPVTGAIVFARNTKAAQRLHAQFHDRSVLKRYWVLVDGSLTLDRGRWSDWIRKVPDQARAEICLPGDPGAKLAESEYSILKRFDGCTLLELSPRTGRMHQLRIQAAHRGHPVLGDRLYGSTHPFGPDASDERDRVIALHARALELNHPFRPERLVIEAPLPATWPEALRG